MNDNNNQVSERGARANRSINLIGELHAQRSIDLTIAKIRTDHASPIIRQTTEIEKREGGANDNPIGSLVALRIWGRIWQNWSIHKAAISGHYELSSLEPTRGSCYLVACSRQLDHEDDKDGDGDDGAITWARSSLAHASPRGKQRQLLLQKGQLPLGSPLSRPRRSCEKNDVATNSARSWTQ